MKNKNVQYDDCFKLAFGRTVREIDGGDNVSMTCLYDALINHSGDSRKQAKALIGCLGASGWKWNAYENPISSFTIKNKKGSVLLRCLSVLRT